MSAVLTNILKRVHTSKPRSQLMVFDLDSTVYDLTLRVTAILESFAQDPAMQSKYPIATKLMKTVEIKRTDWGIRKPLERIGIHFNEHPEFFQEVQAHWARGFFSNQYLDRDFALPGAVPFVELLLEAGADVLYLTGRDVARMGTGTERSLHKCGFPLDGNRARLMLKPEAKMDDALFKADAMVELAKQYETLWLYENEPVNINAVLRRLPKTEIVFIDTCHSGQEEVLRSLGTIHHFEIPARDLADLAHGTQHGK